MCGGVYVCVFWPFVGGCDCVVTVEAEGGFGSSKAGLTGGAKAGLAGETSDVGARKQN